MLQALTPSTLGVSNKSQTQKQNKERYHKQRLAEVKRYIQQLRTEYRFQLITAAGAILQGLKVLGKVNWKQKVTDLIKILKIPARTFRYGLNRLLISNLIGSEGRGEHRRIWWKTPPNDWQHTADDWQHIANDGQHIANDGQHIANESSESIDITAFDESSILFPDSFQTSFNEDRKEDFEIELKIEPEEPAVTRLFEAEVGEAEVVNEVEIEEEESQGNSQTHKGKFSAPPAPPQKSFVNPREVWLRRKAQTLPQKPRNLDMWVRSQLQEKNWEKWSDDYQADQMPKSQPEPAGLREKVANLQAQGVQVGVANIRGEVIVNLPDRGMTAGEFMTTLNEDLVPKFDPEATAKGMSAISEMLAKLRANMSQR
jgi:hypothetical protein